MAGEPEDGSGPLAIDLPASFLEVARSAGIDPRLLAEMLLACISEFTARKLALFIRRGRFEMEAEERGWRRDVEEASTGQDGQ